MKVRIVFIIFPIIIGVIASATGFSLAWRLFILSLLVPVISYLWTFFNMRNIRGETRTLPAKSQIGDVLENRLRLINVNILPKLLLKIQENCDLPGYSNSSIVNIPPRKSYEIESKVCCSRRGQYSIGSYTISAGDPLGLFSKSCTLGEPQNILIYPDFIELPFFDPLSYVNRIYGPGRWFSSLISPNVSSIREYVNGDSLKYIHWHSTAHSSKLMVKLFDPDRSKSSAKAIWVVLDMHDLCQAGDGIQSTEEYGVTIAASILRKYIDQGWPVGLIAEADQSYLFPLETGSHHLELMNTALASIKAQGKLPVEQLINDDLAHFDLNAMTIIITPSWNEKLVSSLLQIKRQQGMVVAILLDSRSFGSVHEVNDIPGSLRQNEIQVYVVKKSDNLANVLDTRKI